MFCREFFLIRGSVRRCACVPISLYFERKNMSFLLNLALILREVIL